MDIYCQRCGEPWDAYGARHGDMDAYEYRHFVAGEGCPCCFGKEVEKRPFRAQVMSAMHDLLGDDIDGIAAEMEDAEALLGSKFWD